MALEYVGDIALISSKSGIMSIISAALEDHGMEGAKASSAPNLPDFDKTPWAKWGNDNLLPKEIAADIENVAVLAAVLDAKARIGTGKGIQPFLLKNITPDGKEELEWIKDPEIHEFLEMNEGFEFAFDSSYDKHAYGWNCGSYVLNLGRNKIYRVKRHDVYEARLEKKDLTSGRIHNLYLSADWASATSAYEPAKQVRIELLAEGNEYNDLVQRLANNTNPNKYEFAFVNRTLRNGRHYYPIPVYRSGKEWIKIARAIPAFKIAMFKNSITLLQKVTIHPKFWEDKFGQLEWNRYEPEERKKLTDEYYQKLDKWLTGEEQAYKTLFSGGYVDPVSGTFQSYVTIEKVDNVIKDGQYLPDSGAAISEILFGNLVNPAMMGAGNPAGKAYGDTSGGSNVRESFLVQLMIMEAERRLNASVFNVVKRFNGWAEKHQGANGEKGILVFRYPSGLLTTLDTGKSTKPENL